MAAGAVVFVGFCIMIYSKLKQIDETIKEVVSSTVNLALKNTLDSNFEIEKLKLTELVMKPITGFTQRVFYHAVNASVKEFNLAPVEKEVTDSVLEGDTGAISLLLNKIWGVDKNISLGLIGLLLNDQVLVLNSIYSLSEEIGFDGEISVAVSEIAMNTYNRNSIDIKKVESTVVLSVKKLFRKLLPGFPLDTVDSILQVALEADPAPLKNIWIRMNFPVDVFDLWSAVVTENYNQIEDSIYKLSLKIIPYDCNDLLKWLLKIVNGDYKGGLTLLADALGFK